jgi:hypothetical protein
MYKISKDTDGIILLCQDCSHVERINSFNESLGSPRTQAARAMQNHSREKHGVGSVLKPIPKELTGSWSRGDKRDGTDSPTTVITIDDRSC